MLTVSSLKRKFIYKGKELADIEGLSPIEVGKSYTGVHPELINSKAQYKGLEDNVEVWEFSSSVGIKG